MILGNNVSKVVIRDLHLTRSTPGAMQGFVTKVTKGQVYLEIPPGKGCPKKFPVDSLFSYPPKALLFTFIIYKVSQLHVKFMMDTRRKAPEGT